MSAVHYSQLNYGAGQSSTASPVHSTLMWSVYSSVGLPVFPWEPRLCANTDLCERQF